MAPFKKRKYIRINSNKESKPASSPSVPDDMWAKCPSCKHILCTKDVGEERICPHYGYTSRTGVWQRPALIIDEKGFEEWDTDLVAEDPPVFPEYMEKIKKMQSKTGLHEAALTSKTIIQGTPFVIGVMDPNSIMGSTEVIVGEKITRLFERATKEGLSAILFTASGGAWIQEGVFSLIQMAKIFTAVKRYSNEGFFYLTVLTDPMTGGITASLTMEGDIILVEPQGLIGPAGRRVIGQTIKQKPPEDFQKAESLLLRGFVDQIVPRMELKQKIHILLELHIQKGWIDRG